MEPLDRFGFKETAERKRSMVNKGHHQTLINDPRQMGVNNRKLAGDFQVEYIIINK